MANRKPAGSDMDGGLEDELSDEEADEESAWRAMPYTRRRLQSLKAARSRAIKHLCQEAGASNDPAIRALQQVIVQIEMQIVDHGGAAIAFNITHGLKMEKRNGTTE